MSTPKLYFGHKTSGRLMQVGEGYNDMGVAYQPVLVSNPGAPSGTEGENLFTAIYLTVDQREEPFEGQTGETATIYVTPIIDGKEYETYSVVVKMQLMNPGFPPRRVAKTYEIGISEPWVRNGIEQTRFALRGKFFQAKVQLPSTEVQLVEAQVEFEPVRESKRAVNDSRGAE